VYLTTINVFPPFQGERLESGGQAAGRGAGRVCGERGLLRAAELGQEGGEGGRLGGDGGRAECARV